eukprot:CAMPEP_0196659908 /NCGR_PEP_ID=MMETSP1086-20130531/37083_1 /TAXON_ID=77921 /ORGANISM="Cyanoptyche  gloeocystis , Strain SAG4.97" /LENGTH=232 /DNA_ID=CAMNT_0041994057 /DNA_START=319 /DNA_END=1019 /DNA_ORIENTATION=+
MTEETDADQLDDEVEYADAIESELPEDEDQPVKVSSRLTPRQRKFLRSTAAMAGKRIPCVQVGKLGLSDSLFRSADEALEANELIKLKVSGNSDVSLGEAAQAISASCGADIAHMIGSCALLYRQSDSRPTLQLPGAPSIPARTVIVPALAAFAPLRPALPDAKCLAATTAGSDRRPPIRLAHPYRLASLTPHLPAAVHVAVAPAISPFLSNHMRWSAYIPTSPHPIPGASV